MLEKAFTFLIGLADHKSRFSLVMISIGVILINISPPSPEVLSAEFSRTYVFVGYVTAALGIMLLILGVAEDEIGAPLRAHATDGMLSGLLGIAVASALSFAPNWGFRIESDYIERLWLPIPYGLAYGGVVGLFLSIIISQNTYKFRKFFSLVIILYGSFIFFIFYYIVSNAPDVSYKPFNIFDAWLAGALIFPLSALLSQKKISMFRDYRNIFAVALPNLILLLGMFLIPIKALIPDNDFYGNRMLYTLNFYNNVADTETKIFLILVVIGSIFQFLALTYIVRSVRKRPTGRRQPRA